METNLIRKNISAAVFDSGIGGLNLLKCCVEKMPNAKFYYLADNFNVPYGGKSKSAIFTLVKNALDGVSGLGLSAAVIACNTATSNCINELREEYPFPIVGIQPAIKPAAKFGGKCLVLATPATVESQSFKKLLTQYGNDNFEVFPCVGLADYIEDNIFNLGESLPESLLPNVKVDSVVLGCTHYLFVKDAIQKRYNCTVFDGIAGTADHLCKILGINDHSGDNLGIFDHQHDKMSNITFIGGDFGKNARVYTHLLNRQ